jgi:hypothetical protein
MDHYVILCDCDGTCSGGARHTIATIDDARPHRLCIEPNPAHDRAVRVEPNARGDRHTPLDLRCVCSHTPPCTRQLPRKALPSTIMAAVDALRPWCEQYGELVSHYECDVPASDIDAELAQEQFIADIAGDSFDGPSPTRVPHYVPRTVIPFSKFLKAVSRLPKDR